MRSFYYSFYRINSQFNDFLAQKIQKEEKSAMRNLKKILALALALVMSLSLMATANAFTDDDSITDTYETAVTVLSGLKVFQGYDDGSFLPKGAITRAEVAAIIYRIVTGDVADTQVGIYADYNKFDDVASTSWYAGYVNFCANAEYIKGYDARTFGPNDPVTGYQALAMILRALGYDKNGEFTGTNWTIQTAAVGENRGITKNISAGTLGTAASREVVAEILFRAILVDTVTYTPAFGYQLNDTSLGYETFKLEDITGVVVANEYADLYSASPMDEGETELNVDGESYTLAYATTVEDLGEARHAYVTGETVLAIADAGNTVWTNEGAETDIGSNSKFEDVTALEKGDAEEYINFGGDGDAYESEYRIEYVLNFESQALLTAFEEEYGVDVSDVMGAGNLSFEKSIRPGNAITEDDLTIIKAIFNDADLVNDGNRDNYIVGEVYVGTQSTTDISDEISYRAFYNEYIDEVGDNAEVDGADNGEWLKVIDNDGDGEADYVFRVDFAMSVINRISKSGVYTLEALDNVDEVSFATTTIDSGDMVTADELAEGDVVIYTLIDGVYYVDLAETVTETIDARGINSKTETITCDGTDYVQSHIGYTDQTNYMWDVTDAHTEVTYDLYLDHFGYVRLLIESDWDSFMLLTDGWYENDNRNADYKAYYWNVDAAEETEIQLTDNDDGFIYEDAEGDEETWGNLKAAGDYYFAYNQNNDPFITNIAGYAQSDDGYSLVDAEDTTRREAYEVKEIKPGTDVEDRVLTEKVTDDRIQTTTDTQYYLVIRDGDKLVDVLTWTGYANSVDGAVLADDAEAYAVTHESDSNNYWIADVVVFETEDTADHDTYFVYSRNNYNREYVWGIGYNADSAIEDQRLDVEDGTNVVNFYGMIEFYEIYDDTTVSVIEENFADNNIYAGTVDVIYDVTGRDYIQVADTAAGYLRFNPEEIPVYVVTGSDKAYPADDEYGVDEIEDYDEIGYGDRMILFTDSDENVLYAIWVDGSVWGRNDTVYDEVAELYEAIDWDANYEVPTATETAVELIEKGWENWTTEDKAAADATYDILNAGTTEDKALAAALKEAIELYEENAANQTELQKAKDAAVAAIENIADYAANKNDEAVVAAYDALVAAIQACETTDELSAIYGNGYWAGSEYDALVAAIAAASSEAVIDGKYYDTLANALAAAQGGDTITLTTDVELDGQIEIPADVTLDGAGYTLDASQVKTESAIVIVDGCTVKNLTVEGNTRMNSWDSNYGIQAYGNGIKATLENVTVTGFDAAILVNGAELTLKGTVDVSGNEFGGIEVSQGDGIDEVSKLIVEGTVVNDTESDTAPTAWIPCKDAQGTDPEGSIEGVKWTETMVKKDNGDFQLWYTIND